MAVFASRIIASMAEVFMRAHYPPGVDHVLENWQRPCDVPPEWAEDFFGAAAEVWLRSGWRVDAGRATRTIWSYVRLRFCHAALFRLLMPPVASLAQSERAEIGIANLSLAFAYAMPQLGREWLRKVHRSDPISNYCCAKR